MCECVAFLDFLLRICVYVYDSLGEVPFRYGHQKCRFVVLRCFRAWGSVVCGQTTFLEAIHVSKGFSSSSSFWKHLEEAKISALNHIRWVVWVCVCGHSCAIHTKCLRNYCVNLFGCSWDGIRAFKVQEERLTEGNLTFKNSWVKRPEKYFPNLFISGVLFEKNQ